MQNTYLTTEQLAGRIHYTPRTIRNELVDCCLFEGVHYIRPFGRRKMLFIWEAIESEMLNLSESSISLAYQHGGVCHG